MSKSLAQGSALGSLLGGSPNQAKGPPTSGGCSQLLRLAGMCILVPSALVHCLGKSGGSAEPAGTPELGGAVILTVPRHDGPHDLVSLISPAGRIYFPPILWKRKLRIREGMPIAQVLPLSLAPIFQEEKASL